MDRNTFGQLCCLLSEGGGLRPSKVIGVVEQVAIFVGVLAHHKKNQVVGFDFWRSGATVSRYMHKVLGAVLNLHSVLLAKPTRVPDNFDDPNWKWFKGCLGALDVEANLEEACFPYTIDEESVASDYVESVEPSDEWSQFRDDITSEMWNSR
ncbi:hypothetical protein AAHA92_10162 [Salvia divinorum]|uniref:DUF8040 domain-containing protein n=1 Tax=Salvia divinorum TaxID=28513 RepID=A0ABD1HXB4_SALDI